MGNSCCDSGKRGLNIQDINLANEIVTEVIKKSDLTIQPSDVKIVITTPNSKKVINSSLQLTDLKENLTVKDVSDIEKPSDIDVYTIENEENIITYKNNPFVDQEPDFETQGPGNDYVFLVEAFQSHKQSPIVSKIYELEGKYTNKPLDLKEYDKTYKEIVKNKSKKLGPYRYKSEHVDYWGDFIYKFRHGFGRVVYKNGSIYEGGFFNDCLTGYGRKLSCEGWMYLGNFVDGKRCGHGMAKYVSKQDIITFNNRPDDDDLELTYDYFYKGEWKNDHFNGLGVEETTEFTYEGNFVDSVKSDTKAKWISKIDNSVYKGGVQNGIIEGKGIQIFEDQSVYEGEFEQNNFHGRGIHLGADKLIYEGQFKEGLKWGIGEQQLENKFWIKGRWIKGERQEDAVKYNEDRKTIFGMVDKDGCQIIEKEIDISALKRKKERNSTDDFTITLSRTFEQVKLQNKLGSDLSPSKEKKKPKKTNKSGLNDNKTSCMSFICK